MCTFRKFLFYQDFVYFYLFSNIKSVLTMNVFEFVLLFTVSLFKLSILDTSMSSSDSDSDFQQRRRLQPRTFRKRIIFQDELQFRERFRLTPRQADVLLNLIGEQLSTYTYLANQLDKRISCSIFLFHVICRFVHVVSAVAVAIAIEQSKKEFYNYKQIKTSQTTHTKLLKHHNLQYHHIK